MTRPGVLFSRAKRGLNIPKGMDKLLKMVASAIIWEELGDARYELAVTYTDDAGIREINRGHRGLDQVTDVLSFPMLEMKNGRFLRDAEEDRDLGNGRIFLGDVVLSVPRAAAQAAEYGHSFEREIGFLTAHSVYHLLGYDHERNEEDRIVMEKKQKDILERIGLAR